MRPRFGVLLVSCAVTLTCAAQEQNPPEKIEPSTGAPLGKVLEWTSAEGKPYWYRLPKTLDKSKPASLLVMLHGTGLKWGWAFWNYPIGEGRFRGDDIVVAPEGMTDGGNGTFNFVQGKADGDHIAALIASFKKKLPVGRVYLYGHSQGAFFAYWFAGEHPELVDGIVAHAGNVLDVKHPKAAKEKIAIGILHGRADAVVPVDCAYATEKVYKDQGYKKIKLTIVEGLSEQTGHWPLPVQVAGMLAWLDSVSVASARAAIEVTLGELRKDAPDFGTVVAATMQAEKLLKTASQQEKAALTERHAALSAMIGTVADEHVRVISQRPDSRKTDPQHGSWTAHFRRANRDLGSHPGWQAGMKDLRQRAVAHDAALGAATAKLEKGQGAAFAEATRAIDASFLAAGYDDLVLRLERIAAAPPKGVRAEEIEKFKALAEAREAEVAAGVHAAAEIVKLAADEFKKSHPTWFE